MFSSEPPSKDAGVLDIPYMKTTTYTLSFLGFWPKQLAGPGFRWYNRDAKKMFVGYFIITVLCVLFIKNNIRTISFLDMGPNYINSLLLCVCLARLRIPPSTAYHNMVRRFLNKMHLLNCKDQNEFAMKTYLEVERLSSFFTKFLHMEICAGVLFYNLTPLYKSYRNGMFSSNRPANATFEQAIYYETPFDYVNNLPGFIIVWLGNCLISFDVAAIAGLIDMYTYVIIFHLWGHIKILKNNLRIFPKPHMGGAVETIYSPLWYDEEESKGIRNLLIESLDYYKTIKEFMEDVSESFGAALCCYFVYFQVCGCILLVETSQMTAEAIGTHGILTFATFQQLIQVSVIFELIASQSETIKDAVYDAPWECMDMKNRKIVLFYLKIAQNPLNFKPLGMLDVGVQTMASIIKTSLSYFMLLRTTTSQS